MSLNIEEYLDSINIKREDEIWSEISVAPEYVISNYGVVRNSKGRTLRYILDRQDPPSRPIINLKQKNYYVDNLVASIYLTNNENKSILYHVDGNILNCSAKNLKWIDEEERLEIYKASTPDVDMSKEIWKPINGFEDYEVSNYGRVRRLEKDLEYDTICDDGLMHHIVKHLDEIIINTTPNGDGKQYSKITLRKDKQPHYKMTHRLVADAFIPNPLNLSQVDHIDGDKSNNRADNLRWVSPQENQLNRHKNYSMDKTPVRCITDDKTFESVSEANKYYNKEIPCESIRHSAVHGTKTHGLRFEYI